MVLTQRSYYKTLNQIIGKNKEVTLPLEKDIDCANNLLNHFMDKIKKINDNLENYELFTPLPNSSNYKLEDFNEISADEVQKIIMESKPTTCGSDPILSTVVKHSPEYITSHYYKINQLVSKNRQFSQNFEKKQSSPPFKKR